MHVSRLESARQAVNAGADGLVHIFADALIDDTLLTEIKERDVFVIPTLSIIASAANGQPGEGLIADQNLSSYLTQSQGANLKADFGVPADGVNSRFQLDIGLENVRRLYQAGVRILAGSDAPNPGTTYGASIHGELLLLVDAGLTPADALKAATQVPAEAFSLDGRGNLQIGSRADLIVVNGDPTTDITATRDIKHIFKNGFEVDRVLTSAAGAPPEQPVLNNGIVSTFETGRASAFDVDWSITTDQLANGNSTATLTEIEEGAGQTPGGLRVDGTVSTKFFFPWSGAGLFFAPDFSKAYDLSRYDKISFMARGAPRKTSIMFFTKTSMQRPATLTFKITEEWQRYEFALSDFRSAEMNEVYGLAITAGRPKGEFYFELDDVRLD